MPIIKPAERVFVALDTTDVGRAESLARELKSLVGGVKVGKELLTAAGPTGVEGVAVAGGLPIFLDVKFHDIPNTVAAAVRATLPLKPFMLNVHAAGGAVMMRAAAEAAGEAGDRRPLVLAVTVLTSLDAAALAETGVSGTVGEQVERLASLAQKCGLDGVVCSAHEAESLRRLCGPDFTLVVPGIRPSWAASDDQRRTTTPAQALALGADYLVIGRPITGAPVPADAARRIAEELAGAQ